MDWDSIFEESYPQPGATLDEINEFVAEIAQPLTAAEIQPINDGQTNPFPKSDEFHAIWRPFEATKWQVPERPLPASYLSLLKWSNGGEFRTGERWFQFFPARSLEQGVRAMLLAYHLPKYMPGAMPIAFNGGGTFYLLDMRNAATNDEYPVVCAHAGHLAWTRDACFPIADSLLTACRGRFDIDDLRGM